MAVSKHILSLNEDLTCSLCLAVFVEPVRLQCEHNFCKCCIQKYWGKQRQAVSCPQCQLVLSRRSYTGNRVLASLCEKARLLELKLPEGHSDCEGQGESVHQVCEEHGEKVILFCEEDEILVCASCVGTPLHSDHRFLPLQQVVQKYKDQLKASLDSMEVKKKSKSELKRQQEGKISELVELSGSLEQVISTQFAKIHQYLDEKEKRFMEGLRRQKEEDLRLMEENLKEIEEEVVSLDEQIGNLRLDIEQQDGIAFLKELRSLRERYLHEGEEGENRKENPQNSEDEGEEGENRKENPQSSEDEGEEGENQKENPHNSEDEDEEGENREENPECSEDEKILTFPRRKYIEFRGPLLYIMWKQMKRIISPVPASLTLDPNTAHCELILSKDLTSVRAGNKTFQLPDLERFDEAPCVLGSQGFTSGKHYWEVEVREKTVWALGVTEASSSRKGGIKLGPEYGYWTVWLQSENKYVATDRSFVQLTLSVKPRTIGVYLDYVGGQVTFYNADDMSHLYTFTDTFTDKLFPFFYPGPYHEGRNDTPLELRHFEL